MKNYYKALHNIAINKTNQETPLTLHVANYWLDELPNYSEQTENAAIKSWYSDLMQGGCQSGFISELIYYKDTHAFFNEYSDDIFALLDELEDSIGEPIRVKDDRKNFYAWLGFEETARKIADRIGLEY